MQSDKVKVINSFSAQKIPTPNWKVVVHNWKSLICLHSWHKIHGSGRTLSLLLRVSQMVKENPKMSAWSARLQKEFFCRGVTCFLVRIWMRWMHRTLFSALRPLPENRSKQLKKSPQDRDQFENSTNMFMSKVVFRAKQTNKQAKKKQKIKNRNKKTQQVSDQLCSLFLPLHWSKRESTLVWRPTVLSCRFLFPPGCSLAQINSKHERRSFLHRTHGKNAQPSEGSQVLRWCVTAEKVECDLQPLQQ